MCSIFFAYDAHPKFRLILAANRDEFYERPTTTAEFWYDAPDVLGGRDLVHGGTWLGVTKTGRFAAVTNYRDPFAPVGNLSRGKLVGNFLQGEHAVQNYLANIARDGKKYSGFNLLVGELGAEIGYFSNRAEGVKILGQGVYGLSNHLLDTPWQKVERGKNALAEIIKNEVDSTETLFEILRDAEMAADENLPATGIGLERERVLSSIFIETPVYGTRCSTILLAGRNGEIFLAERTYRQSINDWAEVEFEFKIERKVDVNLRSGLSY